MRALSPKIAVFAVSLGTLVPSACHPAQAADPPRVMTPTIDIEVEDRAPGGPAHVARFSLSIIDGHAQVRARDGAVRYDLSAHASPSVTPHFSLNVKRSDNAAAGDIDLSSAIPLSAGPRLVVAKIERADGHSTSVHAQVR